MINFLRRSAYMILIVPFGIVWAILAMSGILFATLAGVVLWLITGNFSGALDKWDDVMNTYENVFERVKP